MTKSTNGMTLDCIDVTLFLKMAEPIGRKCRDPRATVLQLRGNLKKAIFRLRDSHTRRQLDKISQMEEKGKTDDSIQEGPSHQPVNLHRHLNTNSLVRLEKRNGNMNRTQVAIMTELA